LKLLEFLGINFDELLGSGDDSNPLMWLVWIVPIIIFMFYGQRIQLQITSSEISKSIEKLKIFKEGARKELIEYLKTSLKPATDPTAKVDKFFEHFTIMPVDMDPNGIVPKVRHIVR